ncbi:MAG: hypothetical protein GY928_02025 [Colwellia sp.]|nr:hypothetical protein [Colwellia sp.]
MEKLTIKHLAPYLPYGLKVNIGKDLEKNSTLTCETILWYEMYAIKPILRPLSDLINTNYHFIYDKETDIESIIKWVELDSDSRLTDKYSYEFWSMLFENHFDIFDLIENNLAIDINTIKK